MRATCPHVAYPFYLQVDVVNLLLIIGPAVMTVVLIFCAPDRNQQYMMCLALFQVWFGYTTLSLSTTMLMVLLIAVSGMFLLAEGVSTEFSNINADLRPAFEKNRTPTDLGITTRLGYMLLCHVFLILHNRKRRRGLRNHAKLLFEHQNNMARIKDEVEQCQSLLQNIFPPEVLERLHNKQVPGMAGANLLPSPRPAGAEGDDKHGGLAERFDNCTFLFAKVLHPRPP